MRPGVHGGPGGDARRLFERRVHIESGGRTLAGIVWDDNTIVTAQHGLYNRTGMVVSDVHGETIPATLIHADQY